MKIRTALFLGLGGAAAYFFWRSLATTVGQVVAGALPGGKLPVTAPGTRVTATGYVNGAPRQIEVESLGQGHYLVPEAAQAYWQMAAAANASGLTLKINSSFRTMAQQQMEFKDKGEYSATNPGAKKPGYSPHQRAVALDIATGGGVGAWLKAHSSTYGFVLTAPNEPWHVAYGGLGYGIA